MQLHHEFVVPVPIEKAWEVLLDVERLAPCMPGAVVDEIRGDEFDGRVKVKVGPITQTYSGTARFIEKDETARRITIKADGREAKGSGTAAATILATMKEAGEDSTTVNVTTDLAITGRAAQMGRGVMIDVSNKLLNLFVERLGEQIAGPPPAPEVPAEAPAAAGATSNGAAAADAAAAPAATVTSTATPQSRPKGEPEAVDLFETAGGPVLKRLVPLLAVLAVLAVILKLRKK